MPGPPFCSELDVGSLSAWTEESVLSWEPASVGTSLPFCDLSLPLILQAPSCSGSLLSKTKRGLSYRQRGLSVAHGCAAFGKVSVEPPPQVSYSN